MKLAAWPTSGTRVSVAMRARRNGASYLRVRCILYIPSADNSSAELFEEPPPSAFAERRFVKARVHLLLMSDEVVLVHMLRDTIRDFVTLALADAEFSPLPGATLRLGTSTYYLVSVDARDAIVAAFRELQDTPNAPSTDESRASMPLSVDAVSMTEAERTRDHAGNAAERPRTKSEGKGEGKTKGSHKSVKQSRKGNRSSVQVDAEPVVALGDDGERVMFTVHLGAELRKSVLVAYA